MYRLITLILVAGFFVLNNYCADNRILFDNRSVHGHSLLELEQIDGENGSETYKYKDVGFNDDVILSKQSFNNGFTLLNIKQPFESKYSDFRVVINGGSSSDPSDLPGIRYFALLLFSKQVNRCMNKIFKDELIANFKIEINAAISNLKFTFLSNQTSKFFSCFLNAISNKMYLENKSYYFEILQASDEFDSVISDPNSIEVDKLAIRMIYSTESSLGCTSLQFLNLFSKTCYKNSINLDTELPKYSHKLISEMFKPHMLSAIFIGNLTTSRLTKLLSGLTRGKLRNQVQNDFSKINRANKAINNSGSNVIIRRGFSNDKLRIHIPFNTDDLKSLESNSHIFVINILDSRHNSGIFNFIFMNKFASHSRIGYYIEYSTIVLYFELSLTRKGLENIPVIIDSIVSYFNLLKNSVISDRAYSEVQQLFDLHLSTSTIFLAESMVHYLSSHFIMSKSSTNILSSNINTQFVRSDVEYFLSKMSLDSLKVSLYISSHFDIKKVFSNNFRNREMLSKAIVEPHTNILLLVFETDDILPNKLSSLSPSYALDTYGLQLPNDELISTINLPSFYSMPIFEKIVPLHKSLDIHYNYLKKTNRMTTISRTMSFKSITTSQIWFSNNEIYGKNVKLNLKFSLREWSPLMNKFYGKVNVYSILSAIHTFTTILNIKLYESLSYIYRLTGTIVELIPSQSYNEAVSDPFEFYLIVNSPINYFSLIMSETSRLLLSFDTFLSDKGLLAKAVILAKQSLLEFYKSYSQIEKDTKVIAQIVSSQHCSFGSLRRYFEQSSNVEFIKAVYDSLLLSPTIYGFIEGNLTPFHANHILNVFIEGLNHKFFHMEINEENTQEFLKQVSYPRSRNYLDLMGKSPEVDIGTFVLDVSTIPNEYKKLFVQKLDVTASSSYSTAAILIGQLNVENYIKGSIINEALKYEALNKFSSKNTSTKEIDFHSSITLVANRFIAVLLSMGSVKLSAGTLTQAIHKSLTESISKIMKNCKSKSYHKKVLEKINLSDPLSNKKFFLSKSNLVKLVDESKEYFDSLNHTSISNLLNETGNLPNVIITTQKVSNIKASISSLDFIPEGYNDISDNYKSLLDNQIAEFRYD
ncbi:secreted insulinase-like peptidase [Cryptosporidium ubiquitum]|uniref:Secreted insulinase-like peptidase n=1 Tax=Cryptosporidium ubiquitum TaxID=857276 RepID=A0A1J4MNC8_9CRYT|nr:secreted insulinase-like peptidase [Cryptosporidium ubiquitum]OII74381.1 secreted insulinase-like peptidase [Cryptosporidium ubiquitum]